MDTEKVTKNDPLISAMFSVGAHYGYTKSRRHPSVKPYVFGMKNKIEIFDLEKTKVLLEDAKNFMKDLGRTGKQVLYVTSKPEALEIVKAAAISADLPYTAGRWIGGTLTNFGAIKNRVNKFLDLSDKREKGELAKFTKKERLLIDREIEKLESMFSGLTGMKSLPAALFVIDSEREKVAVAEARKLGIPVVALISSDCNLDVLNYPVVGNDASTSSISFFVKELTQSYKEGRNNLSK